MTKLKDFLAKLILQGQIPYLMVLKKILFWLAIILPFLIFVDAKQYRDFAQIGWNMLVAVLLVRPLASIFPEIGILRTLIILRKEFGICSALLLIAHFVGFVMLSGGSIGGVVLDPAYWNFKNHFAWGLLGIAIALPVLITSNKFAMLKLKSWWKFVQRFSYLFLLFGGIHIYLIGKETSAIGVLIVAVAWLLAKFKVQIKFLRFFVKA